MRDFRVHAQLLTDSYVLGDASLCRVLLSRDARYPWLILVPRIDVLRDLHEVPQAQRNELFSEIESASKVVKELIDADKINVAALGNQVPQLHVHVIGRLTTDPAWPGPIWGVGTPTSYASTTLSQWTTRITEAMSLTTM